MHELAFTIAELTASLDGELVRGDANARVATFDVDSRRIAPGALFVAMRGARADGHAFVADAHARGAIGAVVCAGEFAATDDARFADDTRFAIVRVTDTQKALEKLGAIWRERSDAVVVGITGSVGKTTAKNILAHLLSTRFITLNSHSNWNTEVGVPLTLGRLTCETEALVVEMAMRGRGQIALLSQIARPDHAVITNTRAVHMELLGSHDEIVQAKLEIVSGLSSDGTLWVNHCEPAFAFLAGTPHAADDLKARIGYDGAIHTFGLETTADVSVHCVELKGLSGSTFELVMPDSRSKVHLPLLGRGAVECVAASAGIAWLFGLNAEETASALASIVAEPGRLERIDTDRAIILNDCYNAGPDSMLNAFEVLQSIRECDRLPVGVVIGDMLELGDRAEDEHEQIGRALSSLAPDIAIVVGKYAEAVKRAASSDMEIGTVCVDYDKDYDDQFAARVADTAIKRAGDIKGRCVLLIKGSRSVGLERVVDALTGDSLQRVTPDV